MELRKYLRVVRQRWLLVLLTLVATLAAGYVSAPKGTTYVATATIVVGDDTPTTASTVTNIFTFAEQLRGSDTLAERAAQIAGIERSASSIRRHTTVTVVDFTQLLKVAVTDEDPRIAQQLSNGLATAFIEEVATNDAARVSEDARLPTDPIEPNLASRLVVAGLFGLVASLGLIVLLEYLDVTIRTAADAERLLGLQVLGSLPLREDLPEGGRGRRGRRAAFGSESSRREALRILRTNLLVATADLPRPTVLVTSAVPEEGKTSTCTELAVSLARDGHRVVLVDADLRHPAAHRWIGARNDAGLSDVLRQRKPLGECLQYVEIGKGADRAGLYFLGTGPATPTPAELLGTDRMKAALEALAKEADYVLVDSPPVLPVADTLVLGHLVSGAVLVVASRQTPAPSVIKARDSLTRNGTRMLGVVVNKLDAEDLAADYGYGFEYGSTAP